MTKLEFIDFDYNTINPIYLAFLHRLDKLNRLKLMGNGLANRNLAGVLFLRNLRTLDLNDNGYNRDNLASLRVLAHHPALKNLELGDNPIHNGGLRHLAGLGIRSLGFTTVFLYAKDRVILNKQDMQALEHLPNLNRLNIYGLEVEQGAMAELFATPTSIRDLFFGGHSSQELSVEEFLLLVRSSNINIPFDREWIQLFINDAERLEELSQALSHRVSITIVLQSVDDESLQTEGEGEGNRGEFDFLVFLEGLEKLTRVNLGNPRLGFENIMRIARIESLQTLGLDPWTFFDFHWNGWLEQIRQARPDLTIEVWS